MINEAARILEEGVAYRPGDVDVIWVRGFGWPVWRGGPLYYADQLGLTYIRDRLLEWGGERLKPAPLLDRLVRDAGTFAMLPVAVPSAG
jgi:3-hydroxyacyl-CoA dehydrogenase